VRRALDARPHIILPDGGLALDSLGYVENLAHALMLAVDQPGPSAGQAYNCGDERTLSLRQMTEVIADALEHDWEIISVPAEVAHPARPLMAQLESHHRVLDLSKLRSQLGYRDVVPPEEALRRTARWLREHPLPPGGEAETILQDPFDYAAEDRLVEAWRKGMELMRAVEYARLPGPTLSFPLPEQRTRKRGG
jgi:hypothetical protein